MTTSIAVVGLRFDGVDVQDIDGLCLHSILRGGPGEPSEGRGGSVVIPRKVGRFWLNRRRDHRGIELGGFIRGTGSDEAAQREDHYANLLAFETLFSASNRAELEATLPGGGIYTIQAITVPPVVFDRIVPAYWELTIPMESDDPDWVAGGS